MKKITLLLFFLVPLFGFSQTPIEKIQSFMNENRSKLGLASQDISDLVIVNEFTTADNGVFIYHVKQRVNGFEVSNSDSNFLIKNGEIINEGGKNFIANCNQKSNVATPSLSVVSGISATTTALNELAINNVQVLESNLNKYKLSNGILTEDPITAQLVYFLVNGNTLKLAWNYEFYSQDTKHLWNVMLDATDGRILSKKDMVISCNFGTNHNEHNHNSNSFTQSFIKDNTSSALALTPGTTNYRVIPFNYESPNHSARQLITNPEMATPSTTAASPNGWHNTNATIGGGTAATQFNYTKGNNAFAYSDYTNANPANPTTYTTASTGAYPNLTFDFAYGGNGVAATSYITAATTNLFYMNNIMHDIWYQYGFTEANKNFQTVNYGRGGTANDAVNAEAQDASQATTPSFNNANFSTQLDGTKPRMQMYLWNVRKPLSFVVNSGTLAGSTYNVNDNAFTAGHVNFPLSPAALTRDLVLYVDSTPDTSDACTLTAGAAAVNAAALAGKIAVIRRGACSFAIKVKFAQNAGAVGVIIVNNAAGGISMIGADATITIPALSMLQADGEALIASMLSGTVNVSISDMQTTPFVNTDGDFDNGIIAHEYTHGISTRLSGNCLNSSEQQGEGWSDWAWLMMQIKAGDTGTDARGIGTFAQNEPTNGDGIREFKYSTDMAVNPHTYADVADQFFTDATTGVESVSPHGVGSIWAVMLWDLAWNFIAAHGYDSNIYSGTGGNNKVMKLVLDAIKLDGCDPSFISARDAIIAADQASNGGANFAIIWTTFARRGLGYSATSGSNDGSALGLQGAVEAYDLPPSLGLNSFQNEKIINIYPNPSNGLVNIKINQFTGKVNLQVIDLNGRVVYSLKNTDFNVETSINLNNLESGMYLIKIEGDELNYTKKIILN
ncbi:T9SS-dependent M36 family metallopeptidase [Flavobacterium sp.]|uniref:T9SS-dependent M36 family metallopeptidase n=1 Tax=Flavobacterium sp. TaxID=239 RepID=UPI00374CF5B1